MMIVVSINIDNNNRTQSALVKQMKQKALEKEELLADNNQNKY